MSIFDTINQPVEPVKKPIQTGVSYLSNEVPHHVAGTFSEGVSQSFHKLYNTFLPGSLKIPVHDTEGVMATVGEVVGDFANPLMWTGMYAAEAAGAKIAAKVGVSLLEKSEAEIATSIYARVFKNSLAGATGGVVDAFERQQSNLDTDYLSSVIGGGVLGAAGGEIIHRGIKLLKRDPIADFVNSTPNLKETQAKIHTEDAIPLADGQTVKIQDMANLLPEDVIVPATPKFEPNYSKVPEVIDNPLADEKLIGEQVEKTIGQKIIDLRADAEFKPWKILNTNKNQPARAPELINADLEASNSLAAEIQAKIDDAMVRMDKTQSGLNSKARNEIKITELPELKSQLSEANFMQAQYKAELTGKRAVLKTTDELDRDALKFDKMLETERVNAQTEHRGRLKEYKEQQREIARKEKELAETQAINNRAEYLHANLENKTIGGLSDRLVAQKAAVANKLDLMRMSMDNAVKLLSEHARGNLFLMKALRGEAVPEGSIGDAAVKLAKQWEAMGYEGVKLMRDAGINTGWLKGRYARLMHNPTSIRNADKHKWMTEVNEHLEVPMTAQEADIRYADITNVRSEMKSILEQEVELENLSRRFRFKSGEDEFWYLQNYGYNYTPAQAMANNIMEVADKVAISHVLGNNPLPVINAFGAISKEEQGIIQGLADEIFPKVLGYKADSVGVVTFMNLIHAGTRLAKAIANPIYQGAFGVTDYQNAVLHVAQKTSIFNSISNIFKSPPDFTKAIAKIPESEKTTLKRALNELKHEFTSINASSYGIASPNGKIAATTKFIRELEFKINGSHQADDVVRKFITKSYAYLLKDAYKSGRQVLEGVDNKLLANAVDQNGFLNPYKLLNSTQSDERKLGFDLLAKYHEGVDAVNPNTSKAWGSVSKDSAGALAWVRQSSWMMKVMQRTNLPILKSLASSQVGGIAKARMGSILLGWAAIQTATEEAFSYMSDALEGKEYKFKPLEVTAKFAGLMAFGGMYWAYKISSVPLLAPVKAGYYATKGVLADNDVDKFENYAKSEKSLMQGSYIAKLALGSWYDDIGNHDSNNNAYAENDSGDMYE